MYTKQYINKIITLYNNAKNNGSICDENKYYNLLLQIHKTNRTNTN